MNNEEIIDNFLSSVSSKLITGTDTNGPNSNNTLDITELFSPTQTYTETQTKEKIQEVENGLCKVTDSSSSALKTPIAKALLSQISRESNKKMFEQFLEAYNGPLGNMDIDYRLGKVKYVKAAKTPSIWTDVNGRMYTRALFNQKISYPTNANNTGLKKLENFVNFFFPPYRYNNIITAEDLNTSWKNVSITDKKEGEQAIQSDSFNLKTFRVDRDYFTYRDPGFKSINDNIEILQWAFEGLTGIVSTYLTEWDISLYIQEGIMPFYNPYDTTKTQPTINLNYRIKNDNPLGYTDDRALVFGVVNAATSKFTLKRNWDVSAYPYSKNWVRPDSSLSSDNLKSSNIVSGELSSSKIKGLEEKDLISKFDIWNAFQSGWKDWSLPFWKAIYTTSDDGLSDQDIEAYDAFANDEPQSAATVGASSNSFYNSSYGDGDDAASSGNSRLKSVGNGSSASKAAKSYVDGQDWLNNENASNDSSILSVGLTTRNPTWYGGPHGRDISKFHPLSEFDAESQTLRNEPRLYLKDDFITKDFEILSDNDNVNGFYYSSPEKIFTNLKNGIKKIRPFTAFRARTYSTIVQVRSITLTNNYYGYYSQSDLQRMAKNKPSGTYVWNPLAHNSTFSNYNYYGSYSYRVTPIYRYDGSSYWDYRLHAYVRSRYLAGYNFSIYQAATYTAWEYTTLYKYVWETLPNLNWKIQPTQKSGVDTFTGQHYSDPNINWQNSISTSIINTLKSVFNFYPRMISLPKSCGVKYRLTFEGTKVTSYQPDSTYSVDNWPYEESQIISNMLDNQRTYSNYLTLMGPAGINGISKFMFQIPAKITYYWLLSQRYHSHRSHRCHTHTSICHYRVIEVDISQIKNTFINLDKAPITNKNLNIYEDHSSLVLSNENSVKNLFSYADGNGILYGTGVISSVPGFDPKEELTKGCFNVFTSNKNVTLGSFNYPQFTNTGYMTGRQVAYGGVTYYTDSIENYGSFGALPYSINAALKRAFTSCRFLDSNGNIVSVDLMWGINSMGIKLQRYLEMLKVVQSLSTIMNKDNIVGIITSGVDSKTNKVLNYTNGESMMDYNMFYKQAVNLFSGDNGEKNIASFKTSLNNEITLIQNYISSLIIGVDTNDLTFTQVQTNFINYKIIQDHFLKDNNFSELGATWWKLLNVFYEYRKHFGVKRFNKTSGTYYRLRHLELLSIAAAQQAISDINEQNTDGSTDSVSTDLDVAYYTVNNSLTNKLKALTSSGSALETDKIEKIYIKVQYPEKVKDEASAKNWENTHLGKKLIRTNLVEGEPYYDASKLYAIKPEDGLYQLKSSEWDKNEIKRSKKELLISKGTTDSDSLPTVYDYDICKKNIVWSDSNGYTPILRGVMEGVDSAKMVEYNATMGDKANTYESLCYGETTGDYWEIDVSDVAPKVLGYQISPRIELTKTTSVDAKINEYNAKNMFYTGRLWPITEDQGVIASGFDEIEETYKGIKKLIHSPDAED